MAKDSVPRLIFASSEESADMLYATKFAVPDPFLFLQQDGKKTILLSDLEIDRGRKEAKVHDIVSLSEVESPLEKKLQNKPPIEQTIVSFLRKKRVRRALVPYDFPAGLAFELARHGVNLIPVNGLFWPERECKNAEEVKSIELAVRMTEIGLARGIEVLRAAEIKGSSRLIWGSKPLTSEVLRAEIDIAILRIGGKPANTIVAGGDQACDPHNRGSGPLKANTLIILDVFPREMASGYFGDLTRTVVRGRASEEQKKLWYTVRQAQELALRGIKIGESGAALQDKVSAFFVEKGYPKEVRKGRRVGFFHGLGHGLGLDLHEQPRIAKTHFKEGQVFTVEPGLYYPGIGGVRIEDDGIVTDKGFKLLSRFAKELEV